jgi:hypothetical protein
MGFFDKSTTAVRSDPFLVAVGAEGACFVEATVQKYNRHRISLLLLELNNIKKSTGYLATGLSILDRLKSAGNCRAQLLEALKLKPHTLILMR